MEYTPKSKEEIINSLLTIQQVCVEAATCYECPFFGKKRDGSTGCVILRTSPVAWEINTEESSWKAFKVPTG